MSRARRFLAAEYFSVGHILAPQSAKAFYANTFADMIGETDPRVAPDASDYFGQIFYLF
ncbi:MAG: hypothetical protein KA956_08225 [Pyrinomonadaceae bacterium]|nr:hypothetical protein [Acidobacteriota bacterium]MBK7933130.1 hypothetical protein [Acidobacteriota bacterium]MBP7376451.1 hypothetical protein [Pyrinomonadaceae bacterium]